MYTSNSNRKNEYYNYIHSKEWKKKRNHALNFYGYNCCLCGSRKKIHVHHRNYKNLFKETMQDLILLCQPCHKLFHKNKIMQNGKESKYMRNPHYDTNTVTYFPERKRFEDSLGKNISS